MFRKKTENQYFFGFLQLFFGISSQFWLILSAIVLLSYTSALGSIVHQFITQMNPEHLRISLGTDDTPEKQIATQNTLRNLMAVLKIAQLGCRRLKDVFRSDSLSFQKIRTVLA